MRLKIIFSALLAVFNLQAQTNDIEEPIRDPRAEAALLAENVGFQVAGNNAFSLELYSRLKAKPGNLFVSPYNITATMVMAYAGAGGITKQEMQSVMRYLANTDQLWPVFAVLNKKLSTAWFQGPNESRLVLANSVWVQRDFKLLPDYTNILNTYFRNSLRLADFIRNSEGARLNINGWVKEKTQGRIAELVAQGEINNTTRLVLVSSIFMKAVWENAFDTSLTAPGSFFLNTAQSISADMMTRSAEFPYFENGSIQVLELPYRSTNKDEPRFSMLILLPRNGDLSGAEQLLTPGQFDNLTKALQVKQVIATIPKFTFSSDFNLNETLQAMGIQSAFSNLADFTSMTATPVAIGDVLHKAFVSVDEKGTEAVAATAVTINRTSFVPEEQAMIFKADHPFLFVIMDQSTGSILFIGRLMTPLAPS